MTQLTLGLDRLKVSEVTAALIAVKLLLHPSCAAASPHRSQQNQSANSERYGL